MKISAFHLMPHRELPADFEQRYHSVWVDPPWWELADAERVGQYYNWTLDELTHGARMGGFDVGSVAPICTMATLDPFAAFAITAPMMFGLGMKP